MESREVREKDDQATILVVDDNKEIVYSISELLKYEGFEVSGCDDAPVKWTVSAHEAERKVPDPCDHPFSKDGRE